MKLFYIMAGISFAVPILILVMTTMMEGTVSVDPQTGIETVVQGFDSVWQMIGTVGESAAGMDMMSMCNINLLYFGFSVLVGLFVTEDFKSGMQRICLPLVQERMFTSCLKRLFVSLPGHL